MLVIESGSVAPGSVFLIANYSAADANSALAAVPDLVTAAVSLPNTRLRLRLYAGDPAARARLVDEADDGSGVPLAGDGDLKRSMVRVQLAGDGTKAESWATATVASGWDPGATEMGTPGSLEGSSQGKTEGRTGGGTTAVRGASWARLKGSLPWCR